MAYGPPGLLELTRRTRYWSASRLAVEAGIDRATISRAEAGAMPSPVARERIARALDTTPAALWPTTPRDANGDAGNVAGSREVATDAQAATS